MSLADLPIDPHEPVYCLCHQVAFGKMIACDNSQVGPCSCLIHHCLSGLVIFSWDLIALANAGFSCAPRGLRVCLAWIDSCLMLDSVLWSGITTSVLA